MKKLILLFVACVTLTAVTSCSKDDDNSASLEGKWEFSKEGFSANGQEALENYEHTPGCNKDFIQITATTVADHTFFEGTAGCEEEIFTTSYTRNGNTLTSGTGADAYTAEIMTLNSSTLKIRVADEEFPGAFYVVVYTRR